MISQTWLEQKKRQLDYSAPGDARDALQAEVESAEAQLARERMELAEVQQAGFIRNRHPGRCAATGTEVGPMAGFVRKENGRWVTYSWESGLELARKQTAS